MGWPDTRAGVAMQWTKEEPKPGFYYWWRPEENIVPVIVYIVQETILRHVEKDRLVAMFWGNDHEQYVDEMGGEWVEIPYPEE